MRCCASLLLIIMLWFSGPPKVEEISISALNQITTGEREDKDISGNYLSHEVIHYVKTLFDLKKERINCQPCSMNWIDWIEKIIIE